MKSESFCELDLADGREDQLTERGEIGRPLFLDRSSASHDALVAGAEAVVRALVRWAEGTGPRTAIAPAALRALVRNIEVCPEDGVAFADVLAEVLNHGVRPFDPACAAHLHCPTLLSAAVTELAIGATNQSMDSFDQAPAATFVEDHLVDWLAATVGLSASASGVVTAGGTASNLLGMLLAREAAGGVLDAGLPADAVNWRIVTSAASHFSIRRAAAVLGLGRSSVVTVPTDGHGRLDLGALDMVLDQLRDEALDVVALVGTAGTTDLGAVDPLVGLADRARTLGAWFHVDAAVGGAFCLSERLRPLVAGIELADSVTVDLHKLWWQPIGASALLVSDAASLAVVREPSDYLDRSEDDELNLVSRSLDTSRRFDALKVLVSLRSTGRRQLAVMLEHLVETAAATAASIDARPNLELLAPPSTVMVVFRWRPSDDELDDIALDHANTAIQRDLFASGDAVVGRTRIDGRVALKLTLVNPLTSVDQIDHVLDLVEKQGADR